jgi:cysteine-rich CPCC protein
VATESLNYPCPCCGYLVFEEPPGSYSICHICWWEDDASQLRYPFSGGGANESSLIDAQRTFARIGSSHTNFARNVRGPTSAEVRDPGWRPLDIKTDAPERPVPGTDSGPTYPDDLTVLYYWRPSYWRRTN